ncbi:MAG TPA: 3D domain-containing protein [Gaiella sp.]
MRDRWGRPAPLVAALAGLALAAGLAAPPGEAEPAPAGIERLQQRGAALARAEHRALLDLYAAEAALERARAHLRRVEARAAALARAEDSARRRARVVSRSLAASQLRVATTLRILYVEGETDPIAVVLGASSLDEVMDGIDGLRRAAAQNRRLGREAATHARRLAALRARLAGRRAALELQRRAAARATGRLLALAGGQRRTLAGIRNEGLVTTRRLAELRAQAREAQRLSVRIARPAPAAGAAAMAVSAGAAGQDAIAAAPATAPVVAPPGGTVSLVVDAVAYHLGGRTASGLPVGPGIVAVDPTVIPLGTRMFVPGYGPGVAADVGSAVKGNIIDLWMPSRAAALRWGRRTVTITIYG